MSLERRRRLVRIAKQRELFVLEDNPYGLLRYEGEPLPPLYALDGGEYVIYLGTFSKILSPGLRLGWTAAPRPVLEKLNLGKQGADLCSSTFVAVLRRRVLRASRLARLLGSLPRRLPAAARRAARGARGAPPGRGRVDAARRRACSSGRRCPTYIDTTDLLARALREHVAFVPGRAAYLDGRGGSSMRLNFSGVAEDDLREGVPRIGKVVSEQVRLYSTLTGTEPAPRRRGCRRPSAVTDSDDPGARIVPLRRRAGGER